MNIGGHIGLLTFCHFPWGKAAIECEAFCTLQSTAEIENAFNYVFTLPDVFFIFMVLNLASGQIYI